MAGPNPSRLARVLRSRRFVHSNWMLTSGAFRGAVAFASNPILVRFIAPEQFGEFALRLAAIGLVFSVLSLRMGVQVIRSHDAELADGRLSGGRGCRGRPS